VSLRSGLCAFLAASATAILCTCALAAGLTVVERRPSSVVVRLTDFSPGRLYRATYEGGDHRFVWENLCPDASGTVVLQDDKHLRPEHRLRCESRISRTDPVVFEDLFKAAVIGKRRLAFGVPVSTFGGPGYLVPGISHLVRDDLGGFWLYLDHEPHAILKYDPNFEYQFALLTPDRVIAHDADADGNLYVLHPGNWLSKHSPLGQGLGAWELPRGREPGEFISASGLAIDREAGYLYLADEMLSRVQRFGLDLELRPVPVTSWGWIGREDLGYSRAGEYDEEKMYYQLDRPRQLRLDGKGRLLVSCAHYVSKFDLASGRQVPFGPHPVLGWGGSFTESVYSSAAALDGHWQSHWLAGSDGSGRIYIADRENEFVVSPRLQVFGPEGTLIATYDSEKEVRDEHGERVYLTAVAGLAAEGNTVWLVDAGGRVYESHEGLRGGGRLHLGPGAAGRQFDLSRVDEGKFTVEQQTSRVRHRSKGRVMGYPAGERGTGNCEREGRPVLKGGERSMWIPARLGEPFDVELFDAEGKGIPAADYSIELEEQPGLFGTHYDFFRVTNRSGVTWENVSFLAEAAP
jgi:hypothetical protein